MHVLTRLVGVNSPYQVQRRNVLAWMHAHSGGCNPLLESLVERLSVDPSQWTHRYTAAHQFEQQPQQPTTLPTGGGEAEQQQPPLWHEGDPLGCPGVFQVRTPPVNFKHPFQTPVEF
jgi:hypothetical protein